MKQSILAGLMIALSAAIYLTIGGPLGAFMFSLGLLTILHFKFSLFTGKAGLLSTKQINGMQLSTIYLCNFIGCACGVAILFCAGLGSTIVSPATAILLTRINNIWYENIALGIICGILMYIAVNHYPTAPYVTMMSVAAFILLGANHCIADMVYTLIAATGETLLPAITALMCTTFGNIIGCNLIPML